MIHRVAALYLLCLSAIIGCKVQRPAANIAPAGASQPAPAYQTIRPIYTLADILPSYPGGEEALLKFLTKNFHIPSFYITNGLSTRLHLSFVVEADGSLTNIKAISPSGKISENPNALEQEGIRIVKLMPKWNPGKVKGKPVAVLYDYPIACILPQE
ncbi:energy transducer TonB [Chitinophaga vietnamensis]|uniref:energy transducer TonB n=1 Tax=Chitinophaga vietnamensis TaxID=2593957 RepID=UPI001177DE8B|nr:energy transducer TonB [Chitinophaga vietnamensis]